MKPGLSVASYRWVCYPPTLHDNHGATIHSVTQPAYLNTGMPLPYTLSITPPAPGDHIEWSIDRATALRLSPLYFCGLLGAVSYIASRNNAWERGSKKRF